MQVFTGTDVMKYTNELSYLRKNFSLPDELSVKSLDKKYIQLTLKLIQTLMI